MTLLDQIKTKREAAAKCLADAKTLREELNGDAWPPDKQEQFDRIMTQFRDEHQAVLALEAQQAKETELEQHLTDYFSPTPTITHQMPNGPTETTKEKRLQQHHAAFRRFLGQGQAGLSPAEKQAFLTTVSPSEHHALMGNVDNLGGFLVPEDFIAELLRDVAGMAVMRSVARVRQTTRDVAVWPSVDSGTEPYPSGVSGSWRGQGWAGTTGTAPPTQDQPTFGQERVPIHIWAPNVIVLTMELLSDAAIDIEAELRQILAETRALDEDSACINGSGNMQPEGIQTRVSAGAITTVNSGAASDLTYGGLVNLYTTLPAQYRANAKFLMNSLTYGRLLQLEDTGNTLVFPAGQLVTQFLGKPFLFSEFMPDGNVGSNNAIIFGDFRYYGIADRMDMRIIRLTERYAPNIGLLAIARMGGQVLRTRPFVAQTISA